MEGGEIITLQFGGEVSNFVGTHFWNIQDDYLALQRSIDSENDYTLPETASEAATGVNNELLYRVSQTQLGQTVATPRLVAVDVTTGLGSYNPLSFWHGEQEIPQGGATDVWSGSVDTYVSQRKEKNEFQQWLDAGAKVDTEEEIAAIPEVEGTVQYWTDYMKSYLHPRSVITLPIHGNDGFDMYTGGTDAFCPTSKIEDISESVRFFLEECDRIQGFHCFVDVNSSFGIIAETLLDVIKDEARSAVTIGFGMGLATLGEMEKDMRRQDLNKAISLARIGARTSLYFPFDVDRLPANTDGLAGYNAKSKYQRTAIAAGYVDGMSSVYRLKEKQSDMHQFRDSLCQLPVMNVCKGSFFFGASETQTTDVSQQPFRTRRICATMAIPVTYPKYFAENTMINTVSTVEMECKDIVSELEKASRVQDRQLFLDFAKGEHGISPEEFEEVRERLQLVKESY
mmetsp:Transcript_3913/g.4517  ORF Transcript_3913/g.4517 Transcript_3913/m.4517 type:complete len:456 (-) Transcript_3913:101-1468(-)